MPSTMKRFGKSCVLFFVASDPMQTQFNHAPNDSPRSGGSKLVTPAVGAVIVLAMIAVAIWFGMRM